MTTFVRQLILSALLTWIGASAIIKVRLDEIMNLRKYDGVLIPKPHQGPTLVNVSMTIHSLSIDDRRQVVELSGELHQEWNNPDLAFLGSAGGLLMSSIGVSGLSGKNLHDNVWRPDLTSALETRPQEHNQNTDFLRIGRDGHLTWTQRIHYSFPCPLNLKGYPISSHQCILKLQSLGYQANEMQPSWNGDTPVEWNSVTVSHGYTLKEVKSSAKTIVTTHQTDSRHSSAADVQWQLRVHLKVQTTSGWAIKHTVCPMSATVITAYLSFFINIRGVAARLTTCLMSFVAAAIFHESTYQMVPPASYTMAIEVFTGTCLAFIFIATVESVVVDVLAHYPAKGRRSTPSPHTSFALEIKSYDEVGSSSGFQSAPTTGAPSLRLLPDLTDDRPGNRGQVAALWLDRCFRVLYPAAFLAFNAVYWVLYN